MYSGSRLLLQLHLMTTFILGHYAPTIMAFFCLWPFQIAGLGLECSALIILHVFHRLGSQLKSVFLGRTSLNILYSPSVSTTPPISLLSHHLRYLHSYLSFQEHKSLLSSLIFFSALVVIFLMNILNLGRPNFLHILCYFLPFY